MVLHLLDLLPLLQSYETLDRKRFDTSLGFEVVLGYFVQAPPVNTPEDFKN